MNHGRCKRSCSDWRPRQHRSSYHARTTPMDSTTADFQPQSSEAFKQFLSAPQERLANLQAELCRRSLKDFIRMAWPIVETSPLIWGWHIDALAEHLSAVSAGQLQKLL